MIGEREKRCLAHSGPRFGVGGNATLYDANLLIGDCGSELWTRPLAKARLRLSGSNWSFPASKLHLLTTTPIGERNSESSAMRSNSYSTSWSGRRAGYNAYSLGEDHRFS